MALFISGTSSRVQDYKRWYIILQIHPVSITESCVQVDKYENGVFGSCPRVYCVGCNVVPCGRSDMPGLDTVKLFCPNCNDIYGPPSSRFLGIDGGYMDRYISHFSTVFTTVTIRGILWNHVCSSFLSELSGACPSAFLETALTDGIISLTRSLAAKRIW